MYSLESPSQSRAVSKCGHFALPPSGLRDNYWKVVKKSGGTIIVLTDEAANILNRITFYDKDSKPIEKHLTQREKRLYLKEIREDITYFNRTYKRSDVRVHISGLNPDQAAASVKEMLDEHWKTKEDPQKVVNDSPHRTALSCAALPCR